MQIAEGYTNLIKDKIGLSTKEETTLYNLRLNICNNCPYKGPNTCNKCGCLIEAKTRCQSCQCPEGYWNSI